MGASPVRTWYLVRHGETEWNVAARMQGRLDSRLTARGEAQARATGARLAQLGMACGFFVSPLGRVRASLALMWDGSMPPVTFDD